MQNLLLVFSILESIVQAIVQIEKALPQDTPGAVKRQAVIDMIVSVDDKFKAVVPTLVSVITALVPALRVTGKLPQKQASEK